LSLARRFSRNLSFILWSRALSAVVNLAFLGVAARHFGVVNFGKLVFILATTSFMELAFCGSADSILVREQTRNTGDWRQNFWACIFLHGCFALTAAVVTGSLAVHWRSDWTVSRGLILAGIASAFQILFVVPVAFFRAEQKMSFEATLITAERIFFLAGFLAIVVRREPMVPILGLLTFSMGMKALAAYLWFFRRWRIGSFRPQLDKLGYLLRESLPMMGFALLLSVHCRVDLFLTKALSSAEQLGIYAASFRVFEMLRVLPVDVITAAFPIFCSMVSGQDKQEARFQGTYATFVRLGLMLAVLGTGIGVLYTGYGTRLLFGARFMGTVAPARILLLAFPLMFWSQINNITLTAAGRQRFMFYVLLAVVGCQTAVDVLFVPRAGAVGAGAAFLTGEAIMLAGTLAAIAPLMLGLKQSLRTAGKLVAVSIAACLLGLRGRTSPAWVLGALFLGAFVLLILLFRVLTEQDKFSLKQGANRVWRLLRRPVAVEAIGTQN
jgi:O-antigen/teichoic acid export membrane protein